MKRFCTLTETTFDATTGSTFGVRLKWCSSLEESCKMYYYTQTLQAAQATISERGLDDLEYHKYTDDYQTW